MGCLASEGLVASQPFGGDEREFLDLYQNEVFFEMRAVAYRADSVLDCSICSLGSCAGSRSASASPRY